jgi:hypothetical protein
MARRRIWIEYVVVLALVRLDMARQSMEIERVAATAGAQHVGERSLGRWRPYWINEGRL